MKRIILFCGILVSIIANACNVCDNSGAKSETKPSEIYFTAKLLNSSSTAVYGINSDGSDLKVILNDSELHCAPSRDGKIIVLKGLAAGSRTIDLYDLKSGKSKEILSAITTNNYLYPGITDNSAKVFVQIGFEKVLLIDLQTNSKQELIYSITHKIMPAFSPNSKMLAFLVDGIDNYNKRLKVVSADNPNQVIYDVKVPYQIDTNDSYSNYRLNWSADNNNVYISVKDSGVSKIARINLTDNMVALLKFESVIAYDPIPAQIGNYLLFADINGSLQKAIPNSDGSYAFTYLVQVNLDEICKYYNFNKTESALIYTKSNKSNPLQFAGNLYVADLNTGNSRYLFSNVYAGFWY